MEIDLFSLLMVFLSSALGSMGLGGGSLLMLYLLLLTEMPQQDAQMLNLLLFLPTAALGAFLHRKNKLLDPPSLRKMLLPGMVGSLLGAFIGSILEDSFLQKLFSFFLLLMALKEFHALWKERKQKQRPEA